MQISLERFGFIRNETPTTTTYKKENLHIDLHLHVLPKDDLFKLYKECLRLFSDEPLTKRATITFGSPGLEFLETIQGEVIRIRPKDWNLFPLLVNIKNLVSKMVGENFDVCYIQYYPNGRTGINYHRDKELKEGSSIIGLSLGAQRTLSLCCGEYGKEPDDILNIPLPPGSIYVIKPPTNKFWLHSIPKDKTKDTRVSITFRSVNH